MKTLSYSYHLNESNLFFSTDFSFFFRKVHISYVCNLLKKIAEFEALF